MKETPEEIGVVHLRDNLADIMRKVEKGKTYILTNNKRRVAKLSPLPQDEKINEEE